MPTTPTSPTATHHTQHPPKPEAPLNTAQLRRNFDRVAPHYNQTAFLAREIDQRMQERLDYLKIAPTHILDLGCSSGASLPLLQQRYPNALTLGIDFSWPMLHTAHTQHRAHAKPTHWQALNQRWPFKKKTNTHFTLADAEHLPIAPASLNLVWSNLLLHCLNEPRPTLRQIHHALAPQGLLMFSTLGPDTLKELREAFADQQAHTQRFTDMHDLGDMLIECGFADPVIDMEALTLTYPDTDTLCRELRASGETCVMHNRKHGLTGRHTWQNMQKRYAQVAQAERLPVHIEIIYGHAWKTTDPSARKPQKTQTDHAPIHFHPHRRAQH